MINISIRIERGNKPYLLDVYYSINGFANEYSAFDDQLQNFLKDITDMATEALGCCQKEAA